MILALGFIFGGHRKVTSFFLSTMLNNITCIIVVIALLLESASSACAESETASAKLKLGTNAYSFDYRVTNLEKFLSSYNSPLTDYAKDFVYFADENGLDYRLVPAITGVESTFGKHIPQNSYNAYGWANGNYSFESWEDSISTVSSTLKDKYIDGGATTINKIARIYAPPSTTWAGKVKYFMAKIDPVPVSFDI